MFRDFIDISFVVVDYLSGFGLDGAFLPVFLYVFNSRVMVVVKYSVWSEPVFPSPPDKPSPEPTLLPLGVKVRVAVFYYFFDSVLHDSVSGSLGILAMGTPALSIKGRWEAFLELAFLR